MSGTWVAILPPLVAISLALLFRQVIIALFIGVWVGVFLLHGADPAAAWTGLLDTFATYLVDALADPDHAAILVFTLLVSGMVGIIARNGGMLGIVDGMTRWASTPKRGQLATTLLGYAIFFDDYANTLVVGNTMRPVTDRLRVSREKLAYIVDSTAAPVATVALISGWIGFQLGLIGDAIEGLEGFAGTAYGVFLNALAYSFYPWMALAFVLMVAWSGRDFGPMRIAEARARVGDTTGVQEADTAGLRAELDALAPPEGVARRARSAMVPIVVMLIATVGGMWVTGRAASPGGAGLSTIIGAADTYRALVWGSALGTVAAFVVTGVQRLLSVTDMVNAWMVGAKSMVPALAILMLAWSLSAVSVELDAAGFLTGAIGDRLHPSLIPALVFVLAAGTAFATGTSWGTMGVMMPLVIPLAWAVGSAHYGIGDPAMMPMFYAAVAAVLAGAVWGDHCSPISDTTILSAMASGCDHIAHVRTQLPYALLVGAVAVVAGLVPVGLGVPWWVCLPVGLVLLAATLRMLGTRVP